MGPVLATEGKLHQTVSHAASQQCVEAYGVEVEKWWGNLIGVQYPIQPASHLLRPENT